MAATSSTDALAASFSSEYSDVIPVTQCSPTSYPRHLIDEADNVVKTISSHQVPTTDTIIIIKGGLGKVYNLVTESYVCQFYVTHKDINNIYESPSFVSFKLQFISGMIPASTIYMLPKGITWSQLFKLAIVTERYLSNSIVFQTRWDFKQYSNNHNNSHVFIVLPDKHVKNPIIQCILSEVDSLPSNIVDLSVYKEYPVIRDTEHGFKRLTREINQVTLNNFNDYYYPYHVTMKASAHDNAKCVPKSETFLSAIWIINILHNDYYYRNQHNKNKPQQNQIQNNTSEITPDKKEIKETKEAKVNDVSVNIISREADGISCILDISRRLFEPYNLNFITSIKDHPKIGSNGSIKGINYTNLTISIDVLIQQLIHLLINPI